MKHRTFVTNRILVSLIFSAVLFYTVTAPLNAYPPDNNKLSAGTVVALALEQAIDSDMPVGAMVTFRVIYDVKVNETVVIKAGSFATGTISSASSTGAIGSPGKVSIDLRSVKAVDGQDIMLRGNLNKEGDDKVVLSVVLALLCLPLILIHGEDAEVPAGTELRAYVEQEYTIKI